MGCQCRKVDFLTRFTQKPNKQKYVIIGTSTNNDIIVQRTENLIKRETLPTIYQRW